MLAVLGLLAGLPGTAAAPTEGTLQPTEESPSPSPHANLFPAVDCIRYVIVNGSTAIVDFQKQMEDLGLWDRIFVQWEQEDPAGKTAGAFGAHVRAWQAGLAAGCQRMMVLEEDVFFAEDYIDPAAQQANQFISKVEGQALEHDHHSQPQL